MTLTQHNDTAVTNVYKKLEFGSLGPPAQKDLIGKSFAESADILFDRISSVQRQVCNLKKPDWCSEFVVGCEGELAALRQKWESEWISLCDGKRFFRDLYVRFGLRLSPLKLKVRIMERLEHARADEWFLVESILRDALRQ